VAREICTIDWGLFAAPSYLAARAPIKTPDDLAGCAFLCPPGPEHTMNLRLQKQMVLRELRMRPRLQSEHFPYLRDAMVNGLGIALLPGYAATDDVDAGRAAPVLPAWKAEGLGRKLYILTMQDRHPSHAARVLTEYLREVVAPLRQSGH
jgi:DNA-binding transcriptional LysR family regulator